uniref:Uncharacterized protein n=1 Tax=Micrurus paraensis TaxID=1970185 RepID=A0A2D4KV65_9SAUR
MKTEPSHCVNSNNRMRGPIHVRPGTFSATPQATRVYLHWHVSNLLFDGAFLPASRWRYGYQSFLSRLQNEKYGDSYLTRYEPSSSKPSWKTAEEDLARG